MGSDMRNGVIRTFSRLGIGAGVLLSFAGAAVTMMVASDQYYKAQLESGAGRIPGAIEDRSPTAPVAAPIDQRLRSLSDVDAGVAPSPAVVATKTSAVGLSVTMLLALAAWGFFLGLGWVVAAFARGSCRRRSLRGKHRRSDITASTAVRAVSRPCADL